MKCKQTSQNGETYVTVAIYMRMLRDIFTNKSNNWRIKWISVIEFETKVVLFSFIQGIRRSFYIHDPSEKHRNIGYTMSKNSVKSISLIHKDLLRKLISRNIFQVKFRNNYVKLTDFCTNKSWSEMISRNILQVREKFLFLHTLTV